MEVSGIRHQYMICCPLKEKTHLIAAFHKLDRYLSTSTFIYSELHEAEGPAVEILDLHDRRVNQL